MHDPFKNPLPAVMGGVRYVPTAQAAAIDLPENWRTMSPVDQRAWQHQQQEAQRKADEAAKTTVLPPKPDNWDRLSAVSKRAWMLAQAAA